MDIVKEAFEQLFPEKEIDRTFSIRYSGKFKPYNANVYITPHRLEFRLSREWKTVNKEIQLGLIQYLLKKVYKTKNTTMNIGLYDLFIRRLEKVTPKTKYDPILGQSFMRNNEKYFMNTLEVSNLQWGSETIRKLGSYDHHTDTITISSIFLNTRRELLDYVMYHEMLHKKIKYKQTGTKTQHHTREFKEMEKRFENAEQLEKEIGRLVSGKRRYFSPYKAIRNTIMSFKRL